ncbi:hypothetical protein DAPPUDRAFT_115860 [Daphnia pulex]|uniref:Uncharacterized protein n=1 Tax=Daphnia pulex TaxID=6669 RepID=E9HMP9_DAPPU|nr:hypothetical protein DAPPUDRAFT_115860 [Daphnia pulex]|eukprot:EFX66973.1 hypothetical protein DAPPUDRAFT_115860 [Daphnia pulex]
MKKSAASLSKKIANMKRTYRLLSRPGASSKGWKWFKMIDDIFGTGLMWTTVELDHVSEVDDGGPKAKKTLEPKRKKNCRKEFIEIEKERVGALKFLAESQR